MTSYLCDEGVFAGLLIKLHNSFHEQGRSVTQVISDTGLISSRYVVTVCLIRAMIKIAAEEMKV